MAVTRKDSATATAPVTGPVEHFDNVDVQRVGDSLVITVKDINHRGGLSASGKTTRVATTSGNRTVAGSEGKDGKPLVIGLNVYVK